MIYSDGVNTDDKMRALECPNCRNTQIDDNDKYCIICGTSLYNNCLGKDFYNEYGTFIRTGESHTNPSNARFCAICGARTIYSEKGFLVPFTDYVETAEPIIFYSQAETEDDSDGELPF